MRVGIFKGVTITNAQNLGGCNFVGFDKSSRHAHTLI